MSQKKLLLTLGLCVLLGAAADTQSQSPQVPASNVTGRSIKAIGYNVGGGGTTVDLKSAGLIPAATGEAKVEAKGSVTTIEAKVKGLALPTPLGTEFLSYVVWAVSPEGRSPTRSNSYVRLVPDMARCEFSSRTAISTTRLR